tara:strand:- start:167 stop:700 length:534 start_codon:yes stop_codon:yes gene_type:complete
METTPQNTQPQGIGIDLRGNNEPQDNGFGGSLQDKLVLKSSNPLMKGDFDTIADKGAISDLLSHLAQVFGNTDLISAAKIELACIQDELLRKHQEAEPQLDFNDVELRTDIQEILESDHWFETVYIGYPSDMQVDCSGCDIAISDVEGEVEISMNQGQAEVMAEKIMDFLEKRTKDA